jgi:acyl carrier protein
MVTISINFLREDITMDLKEKLNLLEDMLELEQGTLDVTTELSSLDEWDSVAGISLIALIDEHFDKRITGDMIRSFKTVQDIIDIMG